MAMVNIKDIPKVDVLIALWKASRMQGMSFIAYLRTGDLTRKTAEEYIQLARRTNPDGTESIYFDYLNGRVMKVDIGQDEFDSRLYDRANGENAELRKKNKRTRAEGGIRCYSYSLNLARWDARIA